MGLPFPQTNGFSTSTTRAGGIFGPSMSSRTGLLLATDRGLCALQDDRIGVPDGMKVDVEGNVYCTGPGGIWILIRAARIWGR